MTKALFAAAFAAAAFATPAFAQDTLRTELALSNADTDVAATIERCTADEATARAVMSCTALIRMSPDARTEAAVLQVRADHRAALGKTRSAERDRAAARVLIADNNLGEVEPSFAAREEAPAVTFAMSEAPTR